jgi:hypothetical protein
MMQFRRWYVLTQVVHGTHILSGLQFSALYKGTATQFPRSESELTGRIFRPNATTTFTEQLTTWYNHCETMREQSKLNKQKLELGKKRACGLLEKELR